MRRHGKGKETKKVDVNHEQTERTKHTRSMKHYNIIHIFREIIKRLQSKRRKQLWLLLVGMVTTAGVETAALGTIALFVASVSDPNAVLQLSYVKRFHDILNADFLTSTKGVLIFLSVLVVVLVVGKNLLRGIVDYSSSLYSAYISSYLGDRILSGFLYLPYEWHLSKSSADLVLGVMWRRFFGLLLNSTLMGLSDILIIFALVLTLSIVEPIVSLLVILVVGGSAFIIFTRIRRSLDRTSTQLMDYNKSINRDVTKAIHGFKDVKICGKEHFFKSNYYIKAYTEARLYALQTFKGQFPRFILEIVGFIMLTSAIYIMYFAMEASVARVTGTTALLAVAAWRILPAISRILGNFVQVRNSLPYVQSELNYLYEIEKHLSQGYSSLKKKDVSFKFSESINFEDVSFAYAGSDIYVLKNVSFSIPKGKTVGIIGISGAGKSTLVDLLIGLLTPSKGNIKVDGKILDDSLVPSWIRTIGYVPQTPYIFDRAIAENIAFGVKTEDIDRSHVLKCCTMAAMDDFMNDLPDGIDTQIGERGVKLSGGQRQRVAIARALYNVPDVLVFDEATSSLDTKSEKAIQNTIYSFKGKQTLVIIAHRLSTVEKCDYIIWLEKGGIAKTGIPDEILLEYGQSMKGEGQLDG